MAYSPCDRGKHAFRGKSNTFYVAVSDGAEMQRERFRLCEPHAALAETLLKPHEVDDDTTPLAEQHEFLCLTCGQPTFAEARTMSFVTAYWAHQERRDFWAMLHNGCPFPYGYFTGEGTQ